jgi:hypothetical protein
VNRSVKRAMFNKKNQVLTQEQMLEVGTRYVLSIEHFGFDVAPEIVRVEKQHIYR